jgi:hypothetical protein
MNYTIIKHTEAEGGYDRYGDGYHNPGTFEYEFFRADGDEEYMTNQFIKAWAKAEFSKYDNLIILVNGIPDTEMNDAEWDEFDRLTKLMQAELLIVKAGFEEAKRIQKEKDAEAALQKAREIAAQQRRADLAQLEALQRKLGIK